MKPRDDTTSSSSAKKYECEICGHTETIDFSWDDVPKDWECPCCGADKDDFILVE